MNDVDKTIKKIEDDLKDNEMEQPVPKGVPTQHGINQRPEEMTPEMYDILMHASAVASEPPHSDNHIELSLVSMGSPMDTCLLESGSVLERLREFGEQLAELSGIDTSDVVNYGATLASIRCEPIRCEPNVYKIRCQDCGYRFNSTEVDAIDLAQLHANRNNHTVSFLFDIFGHAWDLRIYPEKPTWRDRLSAFGVRFYESKCFLVWCLLFLTSAVFSTIMSSGILRVVNIFLMGLCGYHLYSWWKNRWKRKRA